MLPVMTTERLRVGIDGDALRQPMSGVGQYIYQLCRELEALLPEAEFYAYSRLPADHLALPSARWVLRQEQSPVWRKLPSFIWLKTRGAQLCRRDRLDAFWAGRTLHPHLPAPTRTIATVHDLNHLLVPETMERRTLWSNRLWFARDVAHADVVVANSSGTAQRLLSMVKCRAGAVVTPSVGPWFRPLAASERGPALVRLAELGVKPPYLLCVCTLEPRKNVQALLAAFQQLQAQHTGFAHQLVLVGVKGWQNQVLADALQNAEGVVVTGFVPDELLPPLYALADVLVCPSLYEGFGMPVLEARACGTAVVVTDIPELREAGGPGATLVAPTAAGVAEGIRQSLAADHRAGHLTPHLPCGTWRQGAQTLAALLTGASVAVSGQ